MSELYNFLKKSTSHLNEITYRVSFGLNAVFVKDKALLLVTKDERAAIKIDDQEILIKYQGKMKLNDLLLNNKKLEGWYLIPETFNKKKNKMIPLIDEAYSVLFKKRKMKKHKKKPKKNFSPKGQIRSLKKTIPMKKTSLLEKIMGWF